MNERQLLDAVVLQVAEKVRERATIQGRIPFLTGDLRKSVQARLAGRGAASVGSNLSYARAVHDGRKAMTIFPRNAKALRWIGPNGTPIFAKSVRQPARKGKPFLREGLEDVQAGGFGFLDPLLNRHVSAQVREKIKARLVCNVM